MSVSSQLTDSERGGTLRGFARNGAPSEYVHCDWDLELHQPDAELPDRLLGICVVCKTWYLVEGEDRRRLTLIVAGHTELHGGSAY
jgi:hypothetical protein